jgi:hypothetical protein
VPTSERLSPVRSPPTSHSSNVIVVVDVDVDVDGNVDVDVPR